MIVNLKLEECGREMSRPYLRYYLKYYLRYYLRYYMRYYLRYYSNVRLKGLRIITQQLTQDSAPAKIQAEYI